MGRLYLIFSTVVVFSVVFIKCNMSLKVLKRKYFYVIIFLQLFFYVKYWLCVFQVRTLGLSIVETATLYCNLSDKE